MKRTPWTTEGSSGQRIVKINRSLLHVAYREESSQWEVTQRATKYLESMGVPGKGGSIHFLYPEEVSFLMETGNAVVTSNGKRFNLNQVFDRMTRDCFPWFKYIAYSKIRKAGYIIVRHKLPKQSEDLRRGDDNKGALSVAPAQGQDSADSVQNTVHKKESSRFPKQLLDEFPTMNRGKLRMPMIARSAELNPMQEYLDVKFNESDKIFRITPESEWPKKRLGDSRRPLIPAYWPSMNEVRKATSWAEYKERLRKTLDEAKAKRNRWNRNIVRAVRQPYDGKAVIDYDIFQPGTFSHVRLTDPAFRLVVVNGNLPIPCIDHLTSTLNGKIVMAIVVNGNLTFMEQNGRMVELNRLLQTDREYALANRSDKSSQRPTTHSMQE